MALGILKEYLIKIKHEVDNASKQKAFAEIDTTKGKLGNMFKFIQGGLIKSSAMITSALISTNVLLLQTIKSVSDADIEAERFARRMWTTKQNAEAMLTALDAVGSSFEDIYYMTAEEFSRFMQLRNYSMSLEPPNELKETLVLFRDINQEVDKLQILFDYGKKWVVNAFGRYAKQDMLELRDGLRTLTDYIKQNLPEITDAIGKFFYIMFRLGKTAIQLIINLMETLFNLLDRLPTKAKYAGLGITAFLGLLKLGPIGLMIAALTTLLLLLDDYNVWKKGGKSLLGDTWEKLDSALADENSGLSRIGKSFDNLTDKAGGLLEAIFDLTAATIDWAEEVGLIEGLFDGAAWLIDRIADGFELFTLLLEGLYSLLTGDFESIQNFWRNWKVEKNKELEDWDPFGNKSKEPFENTRGGGFGPIGGLKGNRESASTTVARVTSGSAPVTNNQSQIINQTNNIQVQQASNATAYETGRTVAQTILNNRTIQNLFR